MAPPIPPKLVAGTIAAAITLTAGSAIASDVGSESEVPKLEDVVFVTDVTPAEWSSSDLVVAGDESIASPFDSPVSVDSPQSVDSPESVDSPDSVDSPESVDSPDSVDSPESVDSPDSVDSPESVDSPDSVDSPESVDSPDSVDSL